LADGGNWHTTSNLFDLQQEAYSAISSRQAFFRYQLIGFPVSVLGSWRPIEMDKPHILTEPLKAVIFILKA
jgi:hypothetical protein